MKDQTSNHEKKLSGMASCNHLALKGLIPRTSFDDEVRQLCHNYFGVSLPFLSANEMERDMYVVVLA